MSATPPRTVVKYSREPPPSRPAQTGAAAPAGGPVAGPRWALVVRGVLIAGALVAAALLLASEFTTLYNVQLRSTGAPLAGVSTHAHDSWALVPVAMVVAVLTLGWAALGSRLALLALGTLGLVTLGFVLIGDLPDAQATGTVFAAGRYQLATASPAIGMYLETLGAMLLIVVTGCALLLPAQTRPPSES